MCTRLQSITVQCVSARVDHLANILNPFVELLISGRGRRLALLKIVESELEKLWTDSDVSYLSQLFNKYYFNDGIGVKSIQGSPPRSRFSIFVVYILSNVVSVREIKRYNSQNIFFYFR
jgi:hypothetical protein